jgi:hypothetical protein
MTLTREWVDVTPELAAEWLTRIEPGGHELFSDDDAAAFAAAMAAGTWIPRQVPAIKFSRTGNLIDGRHRLTAVTLSRTTVRLYVVRSHDAEGDGMIGVLIVEEHLRAGAGTGGLVQIARQDGNVVTVQNYSTSTIADIIAAIAADEPGKAKAIMQDTGIDPADLTAWLRQIGRRVTSQRKV